MNSLELLTRLEEELMSNRQVERFCKDSLEWVRERKADWEADFVRVGVIGVTSSGKSTLVNAILGADILSKAVVPTSGQLIYCTYGDVQKVTVKFEDGTSKVFEGEEFDKRNVIEYSDARYNPDNEKKVLGIEITSPRYALDKDVILIDSPGLDAYGLEAHEKLTLETMVPTIDVCVYVTTMKANSDKKTKMVLDVLAKHGCPVIVVQNMLDTVKATSDGAKSKKAAAYGHLARIKHIIEESDIDKHMVSVVQMSSEYARQCRIAQIAGSEHEISGYNERYQLSHYEEFISYVNHTLRKQRPCIEKARCESVYACVEDIQRRIDEYMAGREKGVEIEFEYEGLKKRIAEYERYQAEEYHKAEERYINAAGNIRRSLNKTGEISISLDKTNVQVREFGNSIVSIIEKGNELLESAAKEVNIPSRDLMKSMVFQPVEAIAVQKKLIKIEKRRKDLGWAAVLKRGLGLITKDSTLGYHMEYDKRYELDEEGTVKLIEQQLDIASGRYSSMYREWKLKSFDVAVGTINKVIDLAEELHDVRKESTVQDIGLKMFKSDLESLVAEWEEQDDEQSGEISAELAVDEDVVCDEEALTVDVKECISAQDFNESYSEASEGMEGYETKFSQTSELDVSQTVASVLKLSKSMGKNIHNSIAKSLLTRIECMEHTPVIVGWDESCVNEFLWQTGIKDAVICDGNIGDETVGKADKKCFFVLVNTIQFGAAKKQILESELEAVVSDDDYIVWVVQDFEELLTGDNLVEGLQRMVEFVQEQSSLCMGCIWLSHDNPIYNLIFLEHQMEPIVTPQKEQEILRVCNNKYSSFLDKQVVENIMRIIKDVKID